MKPGFWRPSRRRPKDHADADAIQDRLGPIERRVMRMPAVTLAGLAVKALVVLEHAPKLWWEEPSDLDYDDEAIRFLVESVFAAAGDPIEVV